MVDRDGLEQLLDALAADADDMLAVLGIEPVFRPCRYCRREIPADRRPDARFCGDRCYAAAKTARARARG